MTTSPKVTSLVIHADTIDAFEVCNPHVGSLSKYEKIEVGPLKGQYLRLASPDLVLVADALRRLADRIIDATVDSREELAALECPYCSTQIDDGDVFCGSHDCRRQYELDLIGSDR